MAALVAVSLYYIIPPSVKTRLGLDLQGGLEVVYTAKTADGKAPTKAQLDQTVGILDRRVNGLGVTESQIQTQGADQIAIALPGITDAEQALSVIGKTAQLEFFKDDRGVAARRPGREQGGRPHAASRPGRLQGRGRAAPPGGHLRRTTPSS